MKKRLILFVLLFVAYQIGAENNKPSLLQISGQIIDKEDGKSVPYATITLQNDSAIVLKKQSTDVDGKFILSVNEKRKYTIIITVMGYNELRTPIEVKDSKTDMGKLGMVKGVAMKEVTVTGEKQLVKVEVDKITYSVESDPDAKTSNGLEILRKVPLLAVDADEKVTLKGQSNFKVLVNGKSSTMMSSNFKDVIKSLPANSIKNIEVITNPPSKYEAEGVGGIINIITVRKTLSGYNGSVNSGFDSFGSFNWSAYLTSKINKFSFSGRFSENEYKQPGSYGNSTNDNSKSDEYTHTKNEYKSDSKGSSNSFSGEASYDIDTFNLISMSFWGYTSNSRYNSNSTARITDINDVLTRSFDNYNTGKSYYGTISANIGYQKTFMKPDKSFTVSYAAEIDPSNSDNTNTVVANLNYTPYVQKSTSKSINQEHTFQLDYYNPVSKMHQYECGIKMILRTNDNNSQQYRNDTLRTDFSNDLEYDQYILGTYADYIFKLKKFTAKSGLRLERVWNYGVSTSDSVVKFTNRLFNLIPYITLSYQLKENKTFRASYTQRLQRPGSYYLNPYVDNSDPLSIQYGNPNLVSEVSHSFEVGYSTFTEKINLSSSLSASINNNSIENVSSMNASGVTLTTYKNIGINDRYSWNSYFSYRLGSKFNLYTNTDVSYSKYASNNGYNLSNKGFNFYGSMGLRKTLWKDASCSANGGYSSPRVYLQGKSSGYTYSSLGFSQYLLKRKMSLNVSASEPFLKKKKYISDTKGDGYVSHSEGYYLSRNIRFSLSYNFGKMDISVKKANKGITNNDVKGGGSSSGSTSGN